MPEALLGLGGNLGDVPAAIAAALAALPVRGVAVTARSRPYDTRPWGPVEQPDFVNACARVETALSPQALLAVTQALEREGGRMPGPRFGPRTLDIDILAYEGVVLAIPELTLPHPRLTERAFVLVPLAEIAPGWIVAGRSLRDWAAAVPGDDVRPRA